MRLIKGKDLTEDQKKQVLESFVYRWTKDNIYREVAWEGLSKPWAKLVSDKVWLERHAFWFINDGTRLPYINKLAEPVYLADGV